MWGRFQAIWLHGLPFTLRVAQHGPSPANDTIYDLYYCGQGPFATPAALLAANPTRCSYKPSPRTEGWSQAVRHHGLF